MKCSIVELPDGGRAIVCGSRRYVVQRCACGAEATKLCDWILTRSRAPMFGIGTGTITTCDAPLCEKCTTSPAEGKDLCAKHAQVWRDGTRQQALPL
ncbi:MAG TPA: hypothetical protein VE907_06340 [Gammaproteobacteria bacterium]|nr:hypothetical protein [Gammaproteobacteria bacterium]